AAQKLQPLQAALEQLKQGNMNDIQSSALLSEARDEIDREQAQLDAADKVQKMLAQSDQTKDFDAAQNQLKEALAKESAGDAAAGPQKAAAEKALEAAIQGMSGKMNGASKDAAAEQERKNLA